VSCAKTATAERDKIANAKPTTCRNRFIETP
jgi:hypothetical protein